MYTPTTLIGIVARDWAKAEEEVNDLQKIEQAKEDYYFILMHQGDNMTFSA